MPTGPVFDPRFQAPDDPGVDLEDLLERRTALLPLPSFGNYSKLINGAIGSAIGAVVGIGVSYLIANVPGLGECVAAPLPDDAAHQLCTLLGIKDTQITEALTAAVGLLFVHQSPANKAS